MQNVSFCWDILQKRIPKNRVSNGGILFSLHQSNKWVDKQTLRPCRGKNGFTILFYNRKSPHWAVLRSSTICLAPPDLKQYCKRHNVIKLWISMYHLLSDDYNEKQFQYRGRKSQQFFSGIQNFLVPQSSTTVSIFYRFGTYI